jgi:transcriptional regulator with XRE-family HTH domain
MLQPTEQLRTFMRRRREELGLTQVDVARAVGVSSGDFISLVEKGIRKLDLDRMPRLAEVLQSDPVEVSRVALQEQYPLLATVLVGRPSKKTVPTQSEADLAAQKLKDLPRQVRQMVINMIDMLFEKEFKPTRALAA